MGAKHLLGILVAGTLTGCDGVVMGFAIDGKNSRDNSATPAPAPVVNAPAVEPTYAALGEWNAYVKRDGVADYLGTGTPCASATDLKWSSCAHGGELRHVTLPSSVHSCAGLTIVDTLGAFDWTCTTRFGSAHVYSRGLKLGKGLRDLIDPATLTWRANAVRVTGAYTITSASSRWWPGTPIVALPDNSGATDEPVELDQAGTVYVTNHSIASRGYNLAAERVSIVTLGNSKLTYAGAATANCATFAATVTSADASTLICGGHAYPWIEVDADANAESLTFLARLSGAHFARIHRTTFTGGGDVTLGPVHAVRISETRSRVNGYFLYLFESGLVADVRVAEGKLGLQQSNDNVITRTVVSGGAGVVLANSTRNVVSRVTVLGSVNGVNTGGFGTGANILSFVTAAHSQYSGVGVGEAADDTVVHNILTTHSGLYGLTLQAPSSVSLVAALNNDVGIRIFGPSDLRNADNNNFSGLIAVGGNASTDCIVDPTLTAPGLDGGCVGTGTSSALTTVVGATANGAYAGFLSTDDPLNADDVAGFTAAYPLLPMLFDFLNFFGPGHSDFDTFRAWITEPDPMDPGARWQSSGAGRIFDASLALANNTLRNTIANGATPNAPIVAGQACPNWLSGSRTFTDRTGALTFLANAYEPIGDGIGDDNGLCESNEACVAAPNYGAYQGDGDPTNHACTFVDGTVTGVSMRFHPVNGRTI